MSSKLGSEQRNWAMAAHLCGLLWLVGGGSLASLTAIPSACAW